ncbi:type VI secretion system-associated FHA domain protein [Pseudomonas sp. Marseille-Q1929]|uniref:type VI secretion system-associated FHA domain protein n=1 Tax=Pseudomonas sp. Marseille-Q1929 TaxID=2730402 RepID=UPI001A8D217B|nr:type VI secretion system-associated FHA domain protein [Pseudomonas sp. Marseille-Q1929]MBO0495074.1 FHA domain-containing protein [Pseudomonas sp. Marseille-Q1929]
MQLVLEVCSGGQAAPSAHKVFAGAGGVIGRGSGCDWVLPDASRVLSSHHGLVSYRDERYFLTDISSNGIGVAGSAERLRRGQPWPIHDGNVFELGPLAIRARLMAPLQRLAEPVPIPDDGFLAPAPLPLIEEAWGANDTPQSCTERGTPQWDHLRTPTLTAPADEAAAPLPVASAAQSNDAFWAHFAEALGIRMQMLDTPRCEALAIRVARLLKHTLDDLQQCLRTQEALKGELDMDCQGHDGLQDLHMLLGDGAVGELPAQQAVTQAFRDLQAHQVAMLAACRAAVQGVRQAFAPDHLQRCFVRQGKPPRFFREGAHWRAYQRYYQQLIDGELSAEPALGPDFLAAYQDQVRLIATLHANKQG